MNELNDLFEGSVASAVKYNSDDAKELEVRRMMALGALNRPEAEEFVDKNIGESERKENFEYFMNKLLEFNDLMRVNSGTVCFSSAFNHQKSWGTYGDNHAGVCIQFWEDGGRSLVHKHAIPIVYSNERRTKKLIEYIGSDGGLNPAEIPFLFYTKKTTAWEDEAEWRILMVSDREQTFDDRQFEFAPTNVRRIFLGTRIAQEASERLAELAAIDKEWSVFQVKSDHRKGITSFHGVERMKCGEDFEFWSDKFLKED